MSSDVGRALILLVVDDNVDVADTLAIALEADGDVVAKAYGGRAAVLMVEQLSPDVVVSDLEMPDMSGLDEAIAIRKLALATQPWMVAVTGSAQLDIKRVALASGFDYFMAKPTNLCELTGVLNGIRRQGCRR